MLDLQNIKSEGWGGMKAVNENIPSRSADSAQGPVCRPAAVPHEEGISRTELLWHVLLAAVLVIGGLLMLSAAAGEELLRANPLTGSVYNGFIHYYNCLVDIIGTAEGRIMMPLAYSQAYTAADGAAFMLVFGLLLWAVIGVSVCCGRLAESSVFFALVLVPSCISGRVSAIGLAMMLVFMAVYLPGALAAGASNGAVAASGTVQSGRLGGRIAVLAVVLLLVGAFAAHAALPAVDSRLAAVRSAVGDAWDDMRYGSDYVLPEGDFRRPADFTPAGDVVLQVTMSRPESYYLRGFVGSTYTGSGWDELPAGELYNYADLFYWLHKEGFMGQTQLAGAAEAAMGIGENAVSVQNVAANPRYLYAPYELINSDESAALLAADSIGDANFPAGGVFGSREYSFVAADNQVKQYTSVAAGLYDGEQAADAAVMDYLANEAHYNEYVYQSYLAVPQEITDHLNMILGTYDAAADGHYSYNKAKQAILDVLTYNMIYTEDIDNKPLQGDFVMDFLMTRQQGYSVHFASAAALMFRYYGIPARYVEGYLITPEARDAALPGDPVAVYDSDAHAWVEFYQDGVGWIPFEATPAYLDVMEKADAMAGAQISLPSPPPAQTPEDEQPFENNSEQGIMLMLKNKLQDNLPAILLTVGGLLGLLVLLSAVWIMLHRKRLLRLLACCTGDDVRLGCLNSFAYTNGLLQKFGFLGGTNDAYELPECGDAFSADYRRAYQDALAIYQEAAFSCHDITEEQRGRMLDFVAGTVDMVKSSRRPLQRFADRFIYYIYR